MKNIVIYVGHILTLYRKVNAISEAQTIHPLTTVVGQAESDI
jgi:hypothetical protein